MTCEDCEAMPASDAPGDECAVCGAAFFEDCADNARARGHCPLCGAAVPAAPGA